MANIAISALPAATSVAGGDLTVIVQGGVTKNATISQLPSGTGALATGYTQLVNGQNYIDVVFATAQADTNWETQCSVVNTADITPLNIWPGIVTARTTAGFRLQLNGMPDTSNYYLQWSISSSPALPVSVPATAITLSGPSGGLVSVASTNFTVALSPVGGTVTGTITVTPSSGGGGGSFTPTTVGLTTASASATFSYTPASTGAKTISVTNSGTLTNPGSLTYTVTATPHLLNTLISYWKLDEATGATRNDSVATNHLLDITGVGGVAGVINNCASFISASGEYLSCANNASLQVTSDFTFSLWIKPSAPLGNIFLGKYLSGTGTDYQAFVGGGGELVFNVGTLAVGTDAVITPPGSLAVGTWAHCVVWYDHLTGQVYGRVNDSTTYQSTTSPALVQTTGAFVLGRSVAGVFFDGFLDEIGFWKRILTPTEITALYNGGAGLPYSSFTT